MLSLDELMSIQNQQMDAISRTLTNFQKLGQAKMTCHNAATPRKETFARFQELNCKIILAANEKLKATHVYFTQNYFLTCEDYNHEAADYIAEVLDCHEVREPRPAAHDA